MTNREFDFSFSLRRPYVADELDLTAKLFELFTPVWNDLSTIYSETTQEFPGGSSLLDGVEPLWTGTSHVQLRIEWKLSSTQLLKGQPVDWLLSNSGIVQCTKHVLDRRHRISMNAHVLLNTTYRRTADDEEIHAHSVAMTFANQVVREAFLACNLAAPGSLTSIDSVEAIVTSKTMSPPLYYGDDFCELWENVEICAWPPLHVLSLNDVVNWLRQLKIRDKWIAVDRIERALLSFLHYCATPEPHSALLWLSHCLEALYDTPKEGVMNALRERSFLIFGRPDDSTQWKRRISDYYNQRSALVHGTMDIVDPHYEGDHEGTALADVYRANQTALLLSVATFQYLALNTLSELRFRTEVEGIGFTPDAGDDNRGTPPGASPLGAGVGS